MKNYEVTLATEEGLGTQLMFSGDDVFHAIEQVEDYVKDGEYHNIVKLKIVEILK